MRVCTVHIQNDANLSESGPLFHTLFPLIKICTVKHAFSVRDHRKRQNVLEEWGDSVSICNWHHILRCWCWERWCRCFSAEHGIKALCQTSQSRWVAHLGPYPLTESLHSLSQPCLQLCEVMVQLLNSSLSAWGTQCTMQCMYSMHTYICVHWVHTLYMCMQCVGIQCYCNCTNYCMKNVCGIEETVVDHKHTVPLYIIHKHRLMDSSQNSYKSRTQQPWVSYIVPSWNSRPFWGQNILTFCNGFVAIPHTWPAYPSSQRHNIGFFSISA